MTPKDRAFAVYQKIMLDNQSDMVRWLAVAIEEAVAEERENCAKIAEHNMKLLADHRGCCGPADAAQGIANDIRKPSKSILDLLRASLEAPKISLEQSLRDLFAGHGLTYEFSKKYTVKNELTTIFSTEKNVYWSVVATIALTWKTPEEHDAMFLEATKVAVQKWLREREEKAKSACQ